MCIPNQLSPSVSKRELHLKTSLQPQFHQLSVRVLNGQKQNTLPCQCNQKAADGATVTRPFPGSPPPLSELLGSVIRQVAVLHAHYCRLHLLLTEVDQLQLEKVSPSNCQQPLTIWFGIAHLSLATCGSQSGVSSHVSPVYRLDDCMLYELVLISQLDNCCSDCLMKG